MPYQRHPTNHVDGPPKRRSYEEWSSDPNKNFRWLAEWQRMGNYSDAQAAVELGLPTTTFRHQRSGRSPVSKQTAKLASQNALDNLFRLRGNITRENKDKLLKIIGAAIDVMFSDINRR